MPVVKRRTLLQSLTAAPLLSAAVLAASKSAVAKDSPIVYELRVYHAAPGKLPDLLRRFREHTMKLFSKHRMKSIAYWTPIDAPESSNTLIYVLRHPNREAAAANWKAFENDPEWQRVKKESEANGKLTEKVDSTFLVLTDFSPGL
jgi:hypothetical protein